MRVCYVVLALMLALPNVLSTSHGEDEGHDSNKNNTVTNVNKPDDTFTESRRLPETQVVSVIRTAKCRITDLVCLSDQYREIKMNAEGCPEVSCEPCTTSTVEMPGCNDKEKCPALSDPTCKPRHYVEALIPEGYLCHALVCKRCNASTTEMAACRPDSICPPVTKRYCSAGSYLVSTVDDKGCSEERCELCNERSLNEPGCKADQQTSSCHLKNFRNQRANECKKNFFLDRRTISGCSVQMCVPCTYDLANAKPECQHVPKLCTAKSQECQLGQQEFVQSISAEGCPVTTCKACEQHDQHENQCNPLTETKQSVIVAWGSCSTFTCKMKQLVKTAATPMPLTSSGNTCSGAIKWLEKKRAPVRTRCGRRKLKPAVKKLVQCPILNVTVCQKPRLTCPPGQLPTLVSECEYQCLHYDLPAQIRQEEQCFVGQQIAMFMIDASAVKSSFQIKFQVASFIKKFANSVELFGSNGTEVGLVLYNKKSIMQVIRPDECADVEALTSRLLHLPFVHEHHSSSSSSSKSGFSQAVHKCNQLMQQSSRSTAARSLFMISDSQSLSSEEISAAANQLSVATRYSIVINSVFSQSMQLLAEDFTGSQSRVLNLPSFQLLSTNGIEQLLPQCSKSCRSDRTRVLLTKRYSKKLTSVVRFYEKYLRQAQLTVTQWFDQVSVAQYKYEKIRIRMRMCKIALALYSKQLTELEKNLKDKRVTHGNDDKKVRNVKIDKLIAKLKQITMRMKKEKKTAINIAKKLTKEQEQISVKKSYYQKEMKKVELQIQAKEEILNQKWTEYEEIRSSFAMIELSHKETFTKVNASTEQIQMLKKSAITLNKEILNVKASIENIKNNSSSTVITEYKKLKKELSQCEAMVNTDGFTLLAEVKSGEKVHIRQVISALVMKESFEWMTKTESLEYQLLQQFNKFTVGTYEQVRLEFMNSRQQVAASLTFRAAEYDFHTFFSARNLIAAHPWSLTVIKESIDLSWTLLSSKFDKLALCAVQGSSCDNRRGLFAVVTGVDKCQPVLGDLPAIVYSEHTGAVAVEEMKAAESIRFVVRSLSQQKQQSKWSLGFAVSSNMAISYEKLLLNRLLTQPPEAAPTHFSERTFFKSSLFDRLGSRGMKLELVNTNGLVHNLTFSGRDMTKQTLLTSSWSDSAIREVSQFSVSLDSILIGQQSPCDNLQAKGLVFISASVGSCQNLPKKFITKSGWIGLVAPGDSAVNWENAEPILNLNIYQQRAKSLLPIQAQ